jgi:S1-C subfamily serine protease
MAKVIGTDSETDLALQKIDFPKLPTIVLCQMESLQVADAVLAIGNPFGLGQTVSSDIVSALGRKQLDINTFENLIQTDTAINPGNSIGALVDANDLLMGSFGRSSTFAPLLRTPHFGGTNEETLLWQTTQPDSARWPIGAKH